MSRGVVLWPDATTSTAIRALWDALAEAGLSSLSTHTHRRHQPHVSLTIAEELPVQEVLDEVGAVPSRPVRLRIPSVAVFPGGVLFLAVVPNQELLAEQRRVHQLVTPLATGVWPFLAEAEWMPHVTCAYGLTDDQLAPAAALATRWLPLDGWLDHGGVEDGTTGERWPAPS